MNEGVDVHDISAGLHNSIAKRLSSMVRKVGLVEDVALTGGCAKNRGLAKALEETLKVKVITLPVDPQINGAVGAALIAAEKVGQQETVGKSS